MLIEIINGEAILKFLGTFEQIQWSVPFHDKWVLDN